MTTTPRDVEAEARRRAPLNDKFPAHNANTHYRVGFREGADWATTDVIIIPKADLPEVTVSPDGRIQARGATLHNGTATGSDALGWLAIEEHLEKHPPVDEAQVDALAKALAAVDLQDAAWQHYRDQARRLIAAGVRAPQAGDDQ